MIIVFRGYGNHANRLFQAIHIEAFCIENNVDFLNPSFMNMSKYYQERIRINNRIISRLNKRIETLTSRSLSNTVTLNK